MTLSLFFFNDTATTEIYTLSLHDALPISEEPPPGVIPIQDVFLAEELADQLWVASGQELPRFEVYARLRRFWVWEDRKSTRLNSSHANISYAVFCLKKKMTSSHLSLQIPS